MCISNFLCTFATAFGNAQYINHMAELQISKKSIQELLSLSDSNNRGKIYIIPEYQRPYKWDVEKCETLWIDLTNFYETHKNHNNKEYFLGTIVTCAEENDKTNIDVIDGQQRLTSFYLLLRAIYAKLEAMLVASPDDEEIIGLMSSIAPCIWNVNNITRKVTDRKDIHIHSNVASDKGNEVFHSIMKNGDRPSPINPKARKPTYATNYEANYAFFLDKYDEYINLHPQNWKELCLCIIENCIVLPIECTDIDSALTIFGTLNDRGLPLADSDIFKAELYKQCVTPKEKEDFTEQWKILENDLDSYQGLSIDDLFRYYTHVIRGRNKDVSQEIGLRKFYAGTDSKFKLFQENGFFENIKDIAGFWIYILQNKEDFDKEDNHPYCTLQSKKYIQCLCAYPNDYWRYPTTVFFMKHKDSSTFKDDFELFLKQLVAYLFVKYIEQPSVNAIKIPVFNFCSDIANLGQANFTYNIASNFSESLNAFSTSKITKPILLLHAYLYDEKQELLREDLDIEHIFPQKWQNTNYNGWNNEEAKTHLNMFGNKVVLGRRLNIQAGNGYFGQKKIKYASSTVHEVQDLSKYPNDDWLKGDIEKRNLEMVTRLVNFFKESLSLSSLEDNQIVVEITDNEEYIRIYLNTNGEYSIHMAFKDIDNATSLQILNNDVPVKEEHYEQLANIDEAITKVNKVFLVKHHAEILNQIAKRTNIQ